MDATHPFNPAPQHRHPRHTPDDMRHRTNGESFDELSPFP
jgi:hypothetical protein